LSSAPVDSPDESSARYGDEVPRASGAPPPRFGNQRTHEQPAIHLIEPFGRGGVFQHAAGLAELLAEDGRAVTLHTATDAELEPRAGARVCPCMRWWRSPLGASDDRGQLPRAVVHRRLLIGAGFLFFTLPHLLVRLGRGHVAHFEGEFKAPLATLTLALLRLRGAAVVHSRHNTFPRTGSASERYLMRLDARLARRTIVFSRDSEVRVAAWGARPVRSFLWQLAPPVSDTEIEAWRQRWGRRPVVLFAGQVRPDKRLDLLLRAVARASDPPLVAVVGQDLGHAEYCRALAAELQIPVSWHLGYAELSTFLAALAAADVVVCPYERGSQSGIVALSRQLGAKVVAARVGGLAEEATRGFEPGDTDGLAHAIEEAISGHGPTNPKLPRMETLEAHLAAYGEARAECP
jgi:glycosyltransferase involved in cell wall biosynthesis